MTLQDIREGSVLLFNKPFDWSSFDVVNKVKRLTKAKVGHAGTLDPYATGLLILCTGKFTKRIPEFQDTDKEYTGTMVLGATTPSFDMEHEIDQRFDMSGVTPHLILETVPALWVRKCRLHQYFQPFMWTAESAPTRKPVKIQILKYRNGK
jgi:tRNA pseudouridine55 synthase